MPFSSALNFNPVEELKVVNAKSKTFGLTHPHQWWNASQWKSQRNSTALRSMYSIDKSPRLRS